MNLAKTSIFNSFIPGCEEQLIKRYSSCKKTFLIISLTQVILGQEKFSNAQGRGHRKMGLKILMKP